MHTNYYAHFAGISNINSSTATNESLIASKIGTNITIDHTSGNVGSIVQLKAILTMSNGNPIVGAIVSFYYINGTWIGNATTGTDGVAIFNYINTAELKTSYYAIYAGNNSFNGSQSTNMSLIINATDPPTNHTEPTTPTVPSVPEKSVSSLSLFLDRPYGYGYVVGEIATIKWFTSGVANLNQKVLITFVENGTLQHSITALLSDGALKYQFKEYHKTLDIIVTLINSSNPIYDRVPTFVDNKTSQRTFIEIININNLTAGKKGIINIKVLDYKGNSIQSGKISLLFDKKWKFNLTIKNGVATFNKTMILAGNNRTLKIQYNGDKNNTSSSKTVNIVVNPPIAQIKSKTSELAHI